MESIKKYTLTVFNTCTQEYEEVAVSLPIALQTT